MQRRFLFQREGALKSLWECGWGRYKRHPIWQQHSYYTDCYCSDDCGFSDCKHVDLHCALTRWKNSELCHSADFFPPPRLCFAELRDFEPDDQQEIEVDEGNTAVIECHLPESQPKAQVRYSVKQEWLETSKGNRAASLSSRAIFVIYRNAYNPAIWLIIKPLIRVLSGECWNMGMQLFIFQTIYF